MKLIHTGDIHLDSAMKTNLTKEKSKQRNNEIILTFMKMVNYAKENGVTAILIAGDLFDTKNVTVKTVNLIKNCIEENPSIDFLYLKGNHDNYDSLYEESPENLKLFSGDWKTYSYGNVKITGAQLNSSTKGKLFSSLILSKDDINIVMLHGQEANYRGKDNTEIINLKELKDKYIDYLALGHIHTYKEEALDLRGRYCYCGCLEGRGFDEYGEKGFVLIDTSSGKAEIEFIPFAQRTVHLVPVDITGLETTSEVDKKVQATLENIDSKDLVKVALEGSVSLDSERDLGYLNTKYQNDFYAFKIEDTDIRLKINMEDFYYDTSLKGEFIRLVMGENLPDGRKRRIIEAGLKALAGEEPER
ncbi:MAG: metallophosphoesterase [Bacillota bacterium]|nr:metallophosphoesterase [Bacillota bacterium]